MVRVTETEDGAEVTGAEAVFSGDRASVWAGERVLQMAGGDHCTTR